MPTEKKKLNFYTLYKKYKSKYPIPEYTDWKLPFTSKEFTITVEKPSGSLYVTIKSTKPKYKKEQIEFKDYYYKEKHILAHDVPINFDNFFCRILPGLGGNSRKSIRSFIVGEFEPKDKYHLEIWPATKIRYAYLEKNYGTGSGSINSSCMRNKHMQKATDVYKVCNCQIIVVLSKQGKVHGRALFWPEVYSTLSDKKTKPFKYLDRIYYTSDRITSYYEDFIQKNKPMACYNKSHFKYLSGYLDGNSSRYYIKGMDFSNITHAPYTDTFKHLYWKVGVLTGSGLESSHVLSILNGKWKEKEITPSSTYLNYISLSTTSDYGYRRELDKNSIKEILSGNYVSKKDCIFIKRYKGYVSKIHIVKLGKNKDIFYSQFDKDLQETKLDGWGLKKDVLTDFLTHETMLRDSAVSLPQDKADQFSHNKYLIKIQGKLYHNKSPEVQKYKNKYYLSSACFVNYKKFKESFTLNKANNIKVSETTYTKEPIMVPQKFGTVVYNLEQTENGIVMYLPVYVTIDSVPAHFHLHTGEAIILTTHNKNLTKKYNRKYYPIDYVINTDKNQLKLFSGK